MRFVVYDVDDRRRVDDVKKHDLIGQMECTLADIFTAGQQYTRTLKVPGSCMSVCVYGWLPSYEIPDGTASLHWTGAHLPIEVYIFHCIVFQVDKFVCSCQHNTIVYRFFHEWPGRSTVNALSLPCSCISGENHHPGGGNTRLQVHSYSPAVCCQT